MHPSSGRPSFREVDAWGLTHPGNVWSEDQDHFFIGALAQGIAVDARSVTDDPRSVLHPERLASLAIVADGVGSAAGGGEAARMRWCSTTGYRGVSMGRRGR